MERTSATQQRSYKMNYAYTVMPSPAGEMYLVASEKGVAGVLWNIKNPEQLRFKGARQDPSNPFLLQLMDELKEYFAGKRTQFDVPIDMQGTEFQKKVWRGLLSIPYGKTTSYKELAEKIGRPSASRAVGMANGRNPISILVPCHRVIGANGTLTGYAGGLKSKDFLLTLEKALFRH
ncbi:MAG: methylated-DNA--[protein]-cysteine S-methyltransferase [Bdellovibrionales bacterium]|nr:methylated-DNA--[protein]-cysteine S-methyltransferase [Bdellovibrionales bacterium]